MKTCKTCGEQKPLNQYRVDRSCSDGLRSSCSPCLAAASREHYAANRERARATQSAYSEALRAKREASKQLWLQQHADEVAAKKKEAADLRKERQRERSARHYAEHKASYVTRARQRIQDIASRTMQWADLNMIQFFYATRDYMAKSTGMAWHVDHVVPLHGSLASGLHTHHNLCVIPASDNFKKSNKFEVIA